MRVRAWCRSPSCARSMASAASSLPPYCLGQIEYGVVPWKKGRGYAKEALRLILPEAKTLMMPFVELTTDPDNVASQRVTESNRGVLYDEFRKPVQHGSTRGLHYRIDL
ncbi:MAG: GNAT family N-acetyltransferase [Gemmatimonadetes bacterium]|nr:GNAT family N-acetyltransferase [Gemmatimonadota bacterium]